MGQNHSNRQQTNQEQHNSNNEKRSSVISEILSTLVYILIFTGIFLLIQHFLFVMVSVDGQSMYPTLEHDDRLILNKVRSIDRFDIVVFPAPDEPDHQYIKRVIGVPGDRVEYIEDDLYLNGEYVEEPYLDHFDDEEIFSSYITGNFTLESLFGTETVPEGQYFVLGDNRLNSRDSRSFGFVSEEDITGETRLQIWPLDEFGFVD